MISFSVPGIPIAQPRPRVGWRFVKGGGKMPGICRDNTHPVHAFKAAVQIAAKSAYQGPPLSGPLEVRMLFLLPRPKAMQWKKREMPRAWHITRFDVDNLAKSVLDALKGLTWGDDAQVASASLVKMYASGNEQPGVEVQITRLEDAAVGGGLFAVAS